MRIEFINPFTRGWKRMVKALFSPFDIGKWFVVGFSAFLSGLFEYNSSGGNFNNSDDTHIDAEEFFGFPEQALDWLQAHPTWLTLIIIAIVVLFIIAVVLLWVSSRGKFIFLHNVLYDKKEIRNPWFKYKNPGNSLFTWRFAFSIIGIVIFGFYVVWYLTTLFGLRAIDAPTGEIIATSIGWGIGFFILAIIFLYISLFLNDFVVPIMFRKNLNTWVAWGDFLNIFKKHFLYFLLYGLFVLVIYIAIGIGVVIFGLITCCIGFILLVIPYLGSVILLPFSYTFRAFSVEFLEQFGDEYKIFPEPEKELPTSEIPESQEESEPGNEQTPPDNGENTGEPPEEKKDE